MITITGVGGCRYPDLFFLFDQSWNSDGARELQPVPPQLLEVSPIYCVRLGITRFKSWVSGVCVGGGVRGREVWVPSLSKCGHFSRDKFC